MKLTGTTLRLSATDLANHLACHHLSQLDLAVARGLRRPPDFYRPDAAILRERGGEHEDAYLKHLEEKGLRIARPGDGLDETTGFERTLSAMRDGADVIAQATLVDGRWLGRADVLRRVERPSRLGDWSYEVWDTKLARETKGGSVLQICLYSDLLETIQGTRPERMYIVPPRDGFEPDVYTVNEFLAYYRLVRRRLEQAIGAASGDAGPVPRTSEGQLLLPMVEERGAAAAGGGAGQRAGEIHGSQLLLPLFGEAVSISVSAGADQSRVDPHPRMDSLPGPSTRTEPTRSEPTCAESSRAVSVSMHASHASPMEPARSTQPAASTYPEPVPHCDVCRWWPVCDEQRRKDDHLSLVAGIGRLQTRELESREVRTLEALAAVPLPLTWKPSRGAVETYARAREQARMQRDGRNAGRMLYELLPPQPGRGLERLPAPSPGDIFFDLEGDPFVGQAGREYLFGWVIRSSGTRASPSTAFPGRNDPARREGSPESPEYLSVWALDPAAERKAFEAFVDFVMDRWAWHPDLHIYHFAPYEPSAIKRLMGRYATRENEVDRMLRARLFVDLHAIVKQSLRASVEEYSIKKLEPLYGFTREADLEEAGVNLRLVQRALELEEPDAVGADVRRVVAAYNRDDCLSALRLARWLEEVRAGQVAKGEEVARPSIDEGQPSEAVAERDRAVREAMEALLDGVPLERADRTDEQQAQWILAYMLEWHRREENAAWWEFFRLRDLSDEALLDEKAAISGLQHAGRVEFARTRAVDRYRFPTQETSIRRGDKLKLPPLGQDFGEVVGIDLIAHSVDIKKSGACEQVHPASVFTLEVVPSRGLAASLVRLARWVVANGIDTPGEHRAARDLLLGRPPRIAGHKGGPLRGADENGGHAARRLVAALEHGTLAIQGPPGTGKTHTGARMICDLVRAGKKIGVCATSHKVIRNLLDAVVAAAEEEGVAVRCFHKGRDDDDEGSIGGISVVTNNAVALRALKTGGAHVLGGTAWLWSREEFFESVDVLFVDEAGQMSLANVLAIAQCADAVVLLGDPRQLDQPLQGTHPEGTDVSALEHLLRGEKTIKDDRGLFLEETWRLHPSICRFTSELFYDGRLNALPALERQAILGPVPIAGAGLWFLPIAHDGNQSSSPEEVEAVVELVERLTAGDVRWRNHEAEESPLRLEDILIIAPYNAQVADLSARLPGARIGTVDRFQGRQAPVVIYSMTTSTPADAPRGMEFLYSLNRFNVATSRARCACIVVGNPRLFEPECQTPRQMQLANAFCRYLELAQELSLEELRRAGRRV